MSRCIIHFGLLKTGTTSIQQGLFRDRKSARFSYVNLGSPFIGRSLMAAFCRPAWRIAPDLQTITFSDSQKIRADLEQQIAESSIEPLVISCESLSLFTEAELENFLSFLQSRDLMPEAYAYVRDYEGWCESIFQQSCRYGTWKPSLFPLGSGAYRFAIEKFDRLLGPANVKLWKYDRALFPDGCVVRDFFRRSGLGEFRGKLPELNQGLGLDAARLLLAYHRSGLGKVCNEESFRANARLASHTERLGGPPIRFHPDIINNRMLSESADLEWVEKRLGESVRARRADEDESQSIKSEDDLIHFSRASLDWLEAESGSPLPKKTTQEQMTKAVAQAMAMLRDKIFSKADASGSSDACTADLPKTIWIFWGQGLLSAPPLVRACIESWRQMNPGWNVRLLDNSTAEPYLRRAKIPWKWLEKLPFEKRANILRMRLLTEEGGVWTDATTFCLRPLDQWIPDCMSAGFFCFRDPGPDRVVANWFLASIPGNRLACLWRDAHENFWSSREFLHHSSYDMSEQLDLPLLHRALLRILHRVLNRNTQLTDLWFHPLVRSILRTYPYCVMHYLYAHGIRCNPEWRKLDAPMNYRDAKPLLLSDKMTAEGKSLPEILEAGRNASLPLLKLSWKRSPLGTNMISPCQHFMKSKFSSSSSARGSKGRLEACRGIAHSLRPVSAGKRPLCDLRWAGSLPNAHARYASARASGPVCFDSAQSCWCILGYKAAFACLGDTGRFKREPVFGFSLTTDGTPATQHDYRRLLQEALRGFDKVTVASLTDRWLERFFDQHSLPTDVDAVTDLGVPMIDDIAGQMMGLHPDEISALASFRPSNRTDFHGSDKMVLEFFARVFDGRQSAPRSGVIHALDALGAKGVMSTPQAASLARMLWVGATATTNLLIASAMMLLARYPDIQGRLRAEHELVPKLLSEVLRLESPSTVITRRVLSDGVFFGADFHAGDVVKICVLSANTDPDIFDNPLRVDLDRPSIRQLEFGFGGHFCPGANIARELAETAVSRILKLSSSVTAAEDLNLLEYEAGDLRALKRLRIRIS